MNFEEFLKKKKINYENGKWHGNKDALILGHPIGRYISLRDLGNWAWDNVKRFVVTQELADVAGFDFGATLEGGSTYMEIALVCLGKEEIEKRLKVLKNV